MAFEAADIVTIPFARLAEGKEDARLLDACKSTGAFYAQFGPDDPWSWKLVDEMLAYGEAFFGLNSERKLQMAFKNGSYDG
jgi:isopenicillin N synthase-like dioxygenase